MAINIKSPEVVAEIRRLASERQVDLTQAVHLAVKHELEHSKNRRALRLARIRAIAERAAALPIRDERSADDILGYDECGLPS